MNVLMRIIAVLLAAAWPQVVLASVITLSPTGGGVYFLEAQELKDVSGLEITLTYDASALHAPRIIQGSLISGALMMTNTGSPGAIRIAAVRQGPVQGSGLIATITFDVTGERGDGKDISGLKVSAVSSTGQSQVLTAVIGTSSTTPQDRDDGAATQTTAETTAAVMPAERVVIAPLIPAVLPAVVPSRKDEEEHPTAASREGSADVEARDGEREQETGSERTVQREQDGVHREAKKTRRVLTQQSVLERFREFRGPWTVQETIKLFQQDPLLGCRQQPEVVLADGRATVLLTVLVAPDGVGEPEFTLHGGALLSAVKDQEKTNTWVVLVRPQKNISYAYLRVDDGVVVREIPLTVAPRANADLDGSGTVTERDFQLHLRKRNGRGGGSRRDDFLEDYRFAANYLAAVGQGAPKRDAGAKR